MSATTNFSNFTSKIPVGTHVSFLPRALKAQEAAAIGTTKSSKERVYGIVQSYSNEGNVLMACVHVANGDHSICKVKAGNLKKEREAEENTVPGVPAVAQDEDNSSNPLLSLGIDYESDTDESDNGEGLEEVLGEQGDVDWVDKRVTIDVRHTEPSYKNDAVLNIENHRFSTPYIFFKRFLPMDHIVDHVIPSINANAVVRCIENWHPLTKAEYFLWIALWTYMAWLPCSDRGFYWRTKPTILVPSPYNFGQWMSRRRFDAILPAHTLEHPATIAAGVTSDPLVPIRGFVEVYNENLLNAMVPGRVLTIDETMNQWVGKVSRMPNVKKIISKPHPVGQEFKTVADASTNIIIRLDISEKNFQVKKFGDQGAVISTVLRLSEPWFATGRTILADSWFGSPSCAAVLHQYGLYSIMAMKKRSHWPRLVPRDLHMKLEGEPVGTSISLVSIVKDVPMSICILRDRKMQCLVSTCGRTTQGSEVTHVIKEGNRSRFATFHRPAVFDDYGAGKGAVDINNNNRDNMASYHDVMRTHSWEVRAFSFFLALAEANAYLAWRSFGPVEQRSITHFSFREQLCTDMINEYLYAVNIVEDDEEDVDSYRNNTRHDLESIGKGFLKDRTPYSRQWKCQICKKKTTLRCSCTPTKGLCKSNCYRLHLVGKQ